MSPSNVYTEELSHHEVSVTVRCLCRHKDEHVICARWSIIGDASVCVCVLGWMH